jgi:HSP20 family protein
MLPIYRNRGSAVGTLLDLSREMERLMGSMAPESVRDVAWPMPAEIVETGEEIRFDIEMPGMNAADIEITLQNNVLTVTAEKKLEEERNEADYRLFERRYGRMQRSFTVPPTVSSERCDARYDNGVLTLRLPKTEEAKPRRIQVAAGQAGRGVGSGA